jgi:hypothetical protein
MSAVLDLVMFDKQHLCLKSLKQKKGSKGEQRRKSSGGEKPPAQS